MKSKSIALYLCCFAVKMTKAWRLFIEKQLKEKFAWKSALSRDTTFYCVLAENVIMFYCMKGKNVWQKSQGVLLGRMCNLFALQMQKNVEIVCLISLAAEKNRIYYCLKSLWTYIQRLCAHFFLNWEKCHMQISLFKWSNMWFIHTEIKTSPELIHL